MGYISLDFSKKWKKAEKNEKNKKNFKYFLVAEILCFVGFASFRELTETKKYWKWNFPATEKNLKNGAEKAFFNVWKCWFYWLCWKYWF